MIKIYKKISMSHTYKVLPTEEGIEALNMHYKKGKAVPEYDFTYEKEKDENGYVTLTLWEIVSLSNMKPEIHPTKLIKDLRIHIDEDVLNNEEAMLNLHPMSLNRIVERMVAVIMKNEGLKKMEFTSKKVIKE